MKLTNSDLWTLVDDENFIRCDLIGWRLLTKGYVGTSRDGGKSYIFLHNFVLNLRNGSGADHKDRNKLNNTKANLRIATNGQQAQNRDLFSNNTSGFRGVSLNKRTGMYRAQIKVNYNNKHLGNFNSAQEAAKEYDKAAFWYFGAEAVTNL